KNELLVAGAFTVDGKAVTVLTREFAEGENKTTCYARVWDIADQEARSEQEFAALPGRVALALDGKQIVSTPEDAWALHDVASGKERDFPARFGAPLAWLGFSGDGKTLFGANHAGGSTKAFVWKPG